MKYFAIILLIAYAFEGASMSLFSNKEEEVILCSPMEGKLTYNGKAVTNTKLERKITWKDDTEETDTTYTNDKGIFHFPLKKSIIKINPFSQFVVHHEITVNYQDKEYQIWTMGKLGKQIYSELNGKPVNFRCELTDELRRVEVEDGLLGTLCKWDSIEEHKE